MSRPSPHAEEAIPACRRDERGFTLVELLIVILLIGILAAIAIPSLINQRGKANDAHAKSHVLTAQRAMEAYFLDNRTYQTANTNPAGDPDSILTIEPVLADPPIPSIVSADADSYRLRAVSAANTPVTFDLRKRSDGTVERNCTPGSTGGCDSSGNW
jgi:prepilin-type N-terminal cleavage/methylation domain-containing protein